MYKNPQCINNKIIGSSRPIRNFRGAKEATTSGTIWQLLPVSDHLCSFAIRASCDVVACGLW